DELPDERGRHAARALVDAELRQQAIVREAARGLLDEPLLVRKREAEHVAPIPSRSPVRKSRCAVVDGGVELWGVEIGAPDVGAAGGAYARLLGIEPEPLQDGGRRFLLERGTVDIVPGEAGLRAIRLTGDSTLSDGFHGLPIVVALPETRAPAPAGVAIDHIVVRTPDGDRAIRLW